MCKICGCESGQLRIEGVLSPAHAHEHLHAHDHDRTHTHDHAHDGDGALHFGDGAAGASVPGRSQARLVRIEQDILARNDAIAAGNRRALTAAGTLALNLMSSPGAGKTSLLVATLQRLGDMRMAVIEGDQETSADAERIRATGVAAIQVNTGKGCHLDAQMVAQALDHLGLPERGLLFIENVGNLVCPAGFDLGEAHKVVICSVTEGEDKPLKYPGMFAIADLLLVSKIDLLPHLDFDVDRLIANARRINPGIAVLRVSARSGEGMARWQDWLRSALALRQATE
ncbi:MAG: hydrogenase accessory protein HypB [Gammaproteobacteria bacterium HGW-Gammaproteobacteria-4]|jgi:hydrogenase nickel incorporation protein HypB|nr:MAG: hydrogenase accessory protein HypB [Gammaproteobacteria bacterium HGW-Gammaproteobacteria-4]